MKMRQRRMNDEFQNNNGSFFMKPNFQKFIYRKHAVLTDNIIVEAWCDKKRFKKFTS